MRPKLSVILLIPFLPNPQATQARKTVFELACAAVTRAILSCLSDTFYRVTFESALEDDSDIALSNNFRANVF